MADITMPLVNYHFREVTELLMAPLSSPFHHLSVPEPHRLAEDWLPEGVTCSPQLPDTFIEPSPHEQQMSSEPTHSPLLSPLVSLSSASASPHISPLRLEPPTVSRLHKEHLFFSESLSLESPFVPSTPWGPRPASPKPVLMSSHPRRNPVRDLVTPVLGVKVSSNTPMVEWKNGMKTILLFLCRGTSGLNLLYQVYWFPT